RCPRDREATSTALSLAGVRPRRSLKAGPERSGTRGALPWRRATPTTEDAMSTRIGTWLSTLDTKRALALMVGPGALALGVDAAISHFAGREMRNPAQ